jgi:hypothetical protein
MNSNTQLNITNPEDSEIASYLPKSNYRNHRFNRFKSQFILSAFSSTKAGSIWNISTVASSNQTSQLPGENHKLERSKTSTELIETSSELYLEIEAIFWSAKEEFFEDGMESDFSKKLCSTVVKYGSDAIEVITSLIVYDKVCPEVASESLRWLGKIKHSESYEFRLWLLERSLNLSSGIVRDGAILGLASMDDKHAIPYLKKAIKNENSVELKQDMEQVLEQLEC